MHAAWAAGDIATAQSINERLMALHDSMFCEASPGPVKYAAELPIIVTIEEHSRIGGLGSAVAEILAEESFNHPKRFKRIGIPDVFPDKYGSQASLMKRYSISTENLIAVVTKLADYRRGQLKII